MSAVNIDIKNPSASAALKLSFQYRVTPADTADDSSAPGDVRNFSEGLAPDLRERLAEFGNESVTVTIRGTNRVTSMPRWQAEDASSLHHWIAQRLARRDSVTAAPPPKGVRLLDEWQSARQADGIAAHGTARVQLTDQRRVVIECIEETELSVVNPSGVQSLRLRQLDKKTGKTSNVTILQRGSQESGSVKITPKFAAVIEALPS